MKTFQFSIVGWEGGGGGQDHLVKWINAPTRKALDAWLGRQVFKIDNEGDGVDEIGPFTVKDGVDLVLDEQGDVVQGAIGDIAVHPAPPAPITLPCYRIIVTLGKPDPEHRGHYLGGKITSDLHEDVPEGIKPGSPEDLAQGQFDAAMNAIESLILAHACAGIDITAPAYVEGIETAVQACANQLS
ncbi:MAG: hypothetical protein ACHRHE_06990 [Tepidisphaerales bacterium]